MHEYQSRYEHTHRGKVYIKWLIYIGILVCVFVFGFLWIIDYIENQRLTVTQRDFSDLELQYFEYDNGIKLAERLKPAYAFTQGITDQGAKYEGFVFDINGEVKDVLYDCFNLSYDEEKNQKISTNCKMFFEQGKKYTGPTVKLHTEDGTAKGIQFSAENVRYQLYFFHDEKDNLQLMARKEC